MQNKNKIWAIILAVYLLSLILLVVFKYQPIELFKVPAETDFNLRLQTANYQPFSTIDFYLSGRPSWQVGLFNFFGNIIIFAPFGFLFPLVFSLRFSLLMSLVGALFISLAFELTQLIFATGKFDVDDLILNVTGAMIGWVIYRLSRFKTHLKNI